MVLNHKILGANIKYYRKRKNLTQEQLAESLELSVGFISQVERGVTKMSIDTLIDICEFLECSAGELLDNVQAMQYEDDGGNFLALYGKLPKRDKMLFYHMLKAYVENL